MRLTLVSMSGLRVVDPELLELGLSLPGLARRAKALNELPPLGLLTIASMVPSDWNTELITDVGAESVEAVIDSILDTKPTVVAFSSLTAAADRAAKLSSRLRSQGVTTVIGGLHATAMPGWCERQIETVEDARRFVAQ